MQPAPHQTRPFVYFFLPLSVYGQRFFRGFEKKWLGVSTLPLVLRKNLIGEVLQLPDCQGAVIPLFKKENWLEADKLKIPWINFSNRLGPHPRAINVFIDSWEIGQMAADFFVPKGYQSFAYLGVPDCWFDQQREKAFREGLQGKGYPLSTIRNLLPKERNPFRFREILSENITGWLNTLFQPTAIFTSDMTLALALLEVIQSEKRRPEWTVHGVLSVSDEEEGSHRSTPVAQLSYIRPATAEAGSWAAGIMKEMLRGKEFKPGSVIQVKGARLVEHESTGGNPSGDPLIFPITAWANAQIDQGFAPRVTDLATRFGLNKRTLERHFHANTGKSPGQYLLERRLNRAARLLTESTDSIAEIAQNCGFSKQGELNRHFRLRFNRTPREFRKSKSPQS